MNGAEAERLFRYWLGETGSRLPGSRARIHIYEDGTIDAELLYPISRGESMYDALKTMEDAARVDDRFLPVSANSWISVGARYSIKADDVVYRRTGGMNEIGVKYQRASSSNIAEVFGIFHDKSLPGLKKKYRHKAELLYVRLHWNPQRRQPQY